MCYRRPLGVAADDARYPTDIVLQQFKQNLEDFPDLKFQFFSLTNGLTVIYPAIRVDDCTAYDGTLRYLIILQ